MAGVSRVGLVGYCYGGMLGVAMGQKEGACQAIAVAHCDFKVPKDLAALKVGGGRAYIHTLIDTRVVSV